MGGKRPRRELGYDETYQRLRRELLSSRPPCHWCGAVATTADHVPPLAVAGKHYNLVPACQRCNFGQVALKRWQAEQAAGPSNPIPGW